MPFRVVIVVGCCLLGSLLAVGSAAAQVMPPVVSNTAGPYEQPPQELEILGISVEGVENENTRTYVLQSSGLAVGQRILVPGDPALGEAIRNIYKLGLFDDVKIVEEQRAGEGVFLAIRVTEVPKLRDYTFTGIKKSHRKDLQKEVPLIKRMPVRVSDIERAEQIIRDFYEEKGFLLTRVDVERTVNEDNSVDLTFKIDRGPRVEVGDIVIRGNETVSERKLRKQLKETKEDRWWRFWKKETFKEQAYEEDLQKLLQFYNDNGYYDAQIVRDSIYLVEDGEPEVVVELTVHEGPKYHIRNIEWEGNTVYPDHVLTQSLGFQKGDVYNASRLQENLYGNRRSSDVASLYMNRGYMRFNAQPQIQVVEGDSLDLYFDVFEGDVYDFGTISIAGNEKTKEHVIRRELYTIPGQTFSRDAIQESIRRLMQLSYFSQESLADGPGINIDEQRKVVDLSYTVEEVGSDQLELSGTWGRFGLILMLRFGFNNVSIQNFFKKGAWRPIPSGDGQKLSLGIQTNGRYYQSYSLSFTEPWFRGRPTPVGFSLSHSRISRNPYTYLSTVTSTGRFITSSARIFYEQRLKWPDDMFNSSTGLRYQYFSNRDWDPFLPQGVSQEVTFQQTLSRNSLDNPMFPSSGSQVQLTLEVAPPVADFIQYHKWRFKTNWNVPIVPKVSLGITSDYGYIGSLTGDEVRFQRFYVGGSPFETQGFYYFFGSDIVYMRGYPARAIGPRREGDPEGGTILNKYGAELRWVAIQSPQVSAAPYLFVDAANTWDSFSTYDPTKLYRAAGVGARLFLPILGMIELSYGYNFDSFDPVSSRHDGSKRWLFQFSLGQGFGQ
ncbi:MAG: outer membrane protein assembly factor BamA [Bacteroidetes bacterium]|nr:MAG: outer membrane protein assembly factor BamA [Bacteroidota bacterium]